MFCRFCGNVLPDDSAFCGYCGSDLKEPEPQPEAAEVDPQPEQQETTSAGSYRWSGQNLAWYGLALVLLLWALVPVVFSNSTELPRFLVAFSAPSAEAIRILDTVIDNIFSVQLFYSGLLGLSVLAGVLLLMRRPEGQKIAKIAAGFHGLSALVVGVTAIWMKVIPGLVISLTGYSTYNTQEVRDFIKNYGLSCAFSDADWAQMVLSFVLCLGLGIILCCFKTKKVRLSKPLWGMVFWCMLTPIATKICAVVMQHFWRFSFSTDEIKYIQSFDLLANLTEVAWLIPVLLMAAVLLFYRKNVKYLYWIGIASAALLLLVDVYTGEGMMYLDWLFVDLPEAVKVSWGLLLAILLTIAGYALTLFWLIALAKGNVPCWMIPIYAVVSVVVSFGMNFLWFRVLDMGIDTYLVPEFLTLAIMTILTVTTQQIGYRVNRRKKLTAINDA